MARGVSNGLPVPADAELVIEGYFDKAGYTEIEGPYGEFLGYYGPAHIDPVFHVTAITMRKDVLHQTVLHGAVKIARTEHAHQCAILTEARIRQVLARRGHRSGRGLCGAERQRACCMRGCRCGASRPGRRAR